MVIERSVTMALPQYKLLFFSPAKTKVIVTAMAIISIAVYMNISIMYGVIYIPPGPICNMLPNFMDSAEVISILDIVFNFLLPFGAILIFTILTTHCIRMYYKNRNNLVSPPDSPLMGCAVGSSNGSSSSEYSHTSLFDLQTTKVLLYIAISFLLWCLPAQLLRFWVTVSHFWSHDEPDGPIMMTRVFLWQQVLMHIMLVRFVLNFIIYISTYHYFRKALRILLRNALHRLRKLVQVHQEGSDSNGIELQRHDMKTVAQEDNAEVGL